MGGWSLVVAGKFEEEIAKELKKIKAEGKNPWPVQKCLHLDEELLAA